MRMRITEQEEQSEELQKASDRHMKMMAKLYEVNQKKAVQEARAEARAEAAEMKWRLRGERRQMQQQGEHVKN